MSGRTTIPVEIKNQIVERVKAGVSVAQAARDAGVNPKSIYRYMERQAAAKPGLAAQVGWEKERSKLYETIGMLTVKLSKMEKKYVGC